MHHHAQLLVRSNVREYVSLIVERNVHPDVVKNVIHLVVLGALEIVCRIVKVDVTKNAQDNVHKHAHLVQRHVPVGVSDVKDTAQKHVALIVKMIARQIARAIVKIDVLITALVNVAVNVWATVVKERALLDVVKLAQ